MGLASIRLSKRSQARESCSGEPDGRKAHPYWNVIRHLAWLCIYYPAILSA